MTNSSITWIGLAHVRPLNSNTLIGDAMGAFIPAVALAENEQGFAAKLAGLLAQYDFETLCVEDIQSLKERQSHAEVDAYICDLAATLSTANPIALGTFQPYAGEDDNEIEEV